MKRVLVVEGAESVGCGGAMRVHWVCAWMAVCTAAGGGSGGAIDSLPPVEICREHALGGHLPIARCAHKIATHAIWDQMEKLRLVRRARTRARRCGGWFLRARAARASIWVAISLRAVLFLRILQVHVTWHLLQLYLPLSDISFLA